METAFPVSGTTPSSTERALFIPSCPRIRFTFLRSRLSRTSTSSPTLTTPGREWPGGRRRAADDQEQHQCLPRHRLDLQQPQQVQGAQFLPEHSAQPQVHHQSVRLEIRRPRPHPGSRGSAQQAVLLRQLGAHHAAHYRPSALLQRGAAGPSREQLRCHRNTFYDPASPEDQTRRLPFPNNTVPGARFDLAANELIKRLPSPSFSGADYVNNFTTFGSSPFDRDNVDIKVNQFVSERLTYFGPYSISPHNITDPPAFARRLGTLPWAGSSVTPLGGRKSREPVLRTASVRRCFSAATRASRATGWALRVPIWPRTTAPNSCRSRAPNGSHYAERHAGITDLRLVEPGQRRTR